MDNAVANSTLEEAGTEDLVELDRAIAQPADRPWDELVLVCSKCSKKLGDAELIDGHTRLRTEMRQIIRGEDSTKRIRVSDVSCFGVCPQERITIGAFRDGRIHVETVAPKSRSEEVLAHLRDVGAISKPEQA